MAGVASIGQDLTPKFWSGQATIGLTNSAVIGQALKYNKGVQLKADKNNSGIVYISKSSNVSATNGFALYAGDGIFIPIENSASIFAIADATNQKLYWMAV